MKTTPFTLTPLSFVIALVYSVPVLAQTENTNNTQVIVITAEKGKSATKTDTKIKNIPQAISVVSRQEISKDAVNNIDEALRKTSGVTAQSYGNDSRTDWLLVRGFNPARYLDGMALPNGTWTADSRIEPYSLEAIEVLKGPSSLLYGQIPPGGMVNMISKKPGLEPTREIQIQLGSRDHRQFAFDIANAIDTHHRLEYRLTGLVSDGKTQVDYAKDKRYFFAPSLKWNINDKTTLSLLMRYQKAKTALAGGFLPAEGTLTYNPNGQISRRLFTGEPGYDKYDKTMKSAGYEVESKLSDKITLRQNLRYATVDLDHKSVGTLGFTGDKRTLLRYVYPVKEDSQAFTVDNQIIAKFKTGLVYHQVLAGFDYRDSKNDYQSGFGFGVSTLDAFNPVYGSSVTTPEYSYHNIQKQKQYGLYAQDQLKYMRWNATIGLRHDWAKTQTTDVINQTYTHQNDKAWSSRVALGYALRDDLNAYSAYSTSFQPTVGTTFNGNAFKPTKGRQLEFGVKYQPRSNALITAAIYDLEQTNVSTVDPDHVFYAVQQGKVRVKGAEFEAKYKINRNLSINGSYSYTDAKITRSNDAAQLGSKVPLVPRHQVKAGIGYQFTENALKGLGLSVGVRYTGKHYGAAGNLYQTPSYTLFDASISYDIEKWRFQINASNLFDKRYVTACNQSFWCYYGAGRDMKLTAIYKF